MKVGKVSETILKRSVFKQIQHRREEVLVQPGVGKDCSVVELKEDEVMVLSTDPITGTLYDMGTLGVHITANDIASSGAEVIGIMLTVLLPENTKEGEFRNLIQEFESTCKQLNIEIIGGHSEVTRAVNQPVVSVTGVGKIKKEDNDKMTGVQIGQDIVMTKWAGLEGTSIIAKEREQDLLTRYTKTFLNQAKTFTEHLSIIKEAEIGKKFAVTAMHDVTEGGIYGALWEFGAMSDVGLDINLKKIILRQETVEICEFFDLNPYYLISSGCLIMSTFRGADLVNELQKQGIQAAVIGKAVEGKERIVRNEDEKRYLEPPKSDELYKVIGGERK